MEGIDCRWEEGKMEGWIKRIVENTGEEGKSDSAKIISLFNRNAAGGRLGSLFSC